MYYYVKSSVEMDVARSCLVVLTKYLPLNADGHTHEYLSMPSTQNPVKNKFFMFQQLTMISLKRQIHSIKVLLDTLIPTELGNQHWTFFLLFTSNGGLGN